MAESPVLDEQKLDALGRMLSSRFEQYEKDRKALEEQWMKNLRQFRGVYDPEIQSKIAPGQSRAYPKITRQKVIGTVARLMEMLFPQTEKNWGIAPSPIPNLSEEDLQATLDLMQEEAQGADLPTDQIEKRIREVAEGKAEKMSRMIDDQLSETEYITRAKKVVFSGCLYGTGLLEGPFTKMEKKRKWRRNPITRKYEAEEVKSLKPFYEVLPVWNWYPDLSAKSLDQQDGYFKRPVMSRAQVAALADRPDFFADKIRDWLRKNEGGNYKERWWETEIRKDGDRKNPENLSGRKYELRRWCGTLSGHDLQAAGETISEDRLSDEHESEVWLLDNVVIKAKLNPSDTRRRPIHEFIFEEDDINLAGIGLPQVVRDSQLGICEAVRMMFDNGSITCGPSLLLRLGLLAPGQDTNIHSFKTWFADPDAENTNVSPVENINIENHIADLLQIVKLSMEFMDAETALPPPALGDVTQGGSEALRTRGNASMFLGAASLPIRDTVRNFDSFTTSFISSLYDWNMEFNEDPTIKGDYQIIARGSTSLIAKEVRGMALDNLAQTLQPEERVYIKGKEFLRERLKVRDLDMESILEDDDKVVAKQAQLAQQAQEQRTQQSKLIEAEVQETLSQALKNAALARKADVGADVDVHKTVIQGVKDAADIDQKRREGDRRSSTSTKG